MSKYARDVGVLQAPAPGVVCHSVPVISCLDDDKTHPFPPAQVQHLRFLELPCACRL